MNQVLLFADTVLIPFVILLWALTQRICEWRFSSFVRSDSLKAQSWKFSLELSSDSLEGSMN